MELEEIGAVKLPKLLQAKILPVVNIKLEVNMGVIRLVDSSTPESLTPKIQPRLFNPSVKKNPLSILFFRNVFFRGYLKSIWLGVHKES